MSIELKTVNHGRLLSFNNQSKLSPYLEILVANDNVGGLSRNKIIIQEGQLGALHVGVLPPILFNQDLRDDVDHLCRCPQQPITPEVGLNE